MRNLIISYLTILLLVFASCEQDIVNDFESITKKNNDSSIEHFENLDNSFQEELHRGDPTLTVSALNLDCIPNSKFVVRATYNDQTNSISFEYYTNSANTSPVSPASINWSVDNGLLALDDSGSETGTGFVFDTDYNVGISIVFDDGSVFQDQFCVNIDKADTSAFNVCSEHESTVGCSENSRGDNKRALVIVEVIL